MIKKILLLIITLTVCVNVQADYYPNQYKWETEVFYGTAHITREGGKLIEADSNKSKGEAANSVFFKQKDTVTVTGLRQTFMFDERFAIEFGYRDPSKLAREYDNTTACPSCEWDWKYTDRDLYMLEMGVRLTQSDFIDNMTFELRAGFSGIEYTTIYNYDTKKSTGRGNVNVKHNQKTIVPYVGISAKYHIDNWFITANIHHLEAKFDHGEEMSYSDASIGIGYSY